MNDSQTNPIDDSKMSIGEHLEELRSHVLRAVIYTVIVLVITMNFQEKVMEIATWPHRSTMETIARDAQLSDVTPFVDSEVRSLIGQISKTQHDLEKQFARTERFQQLLAQRLEKAPAKSLKLALEQQQKVIESLAALQNEQQSALDASNVDAKKLNQLQTRFEEARKSVKELGPRVENVRRLIDLSENSVRVKVRLQQLSYPEAFLSYLKVCLILSLFIAGPLIGREMWLFVEKGLYEEEKKWVQVVAPLSLFAFLCGICFGYFILIPYGLQYLATYGGGDVIEGSITLAEYLSLFITLTLIVGLFFQLPLIMSFLALIGVLDDRSYANGRRYFYLGSVIVSAILTPPDPVTQLLMWMPLVFLYEIGIWTSFFIRRGREKAMEIQQLEEGTAAAMAEQRADSEATTPAIATNAESTDASASEQPSTAVESTKNEAKSEAPKTESGDDNDDDENEEEMSESEREAYKAAKLNRPDPEDEIETEVETEVTAESEAVATSPVVEREQSEIAVSEQTQASEAQQDSAAAANANESAEVSSEPVATSDDSEVMAEEDYPAEWFEEDDYDETADLRAELGQRPEQAEEAVRGEAEADQAEVGPSDKSSAEANADSESTSEKADEQEEENKRDEHSGGND